MFAVWMTWAGIALAKSPLDAYATAIGKAPISTAVDQKNTFRDLSFGAACSTTPGFTTNKSIGNLVSYKRAGDKLSIGAATLKTLGYLCTNDRLAVVVMTADPSDSLLLTSALRSTYGAAGISETDFSYWRGMTRTVWTLRSADTFMVGIGDLPYGDPVVMMTTLLQASNKAAAGDL